MIKIQNGFFRNTLKTYLWNFFQKIVGNPNIIRSLQTPVILKMLDFKKTDIVLDGGCGNGFFVEKISHNVTLCVGIDRSIDTDHLFIRQHDDNSLFVQTTLLWLPFREGTFDKIVLSSVLQMVEDDKTLLDECYRVLNKNGILVLTVPISYIYFSKLNQRKPQLNKKFNVAGKGYYEVSDLHTLLNKTGFVVLKTEYSPKRIGSFVYEFWLLICDSLNFPLYNAIYFIIQYPLTFIDRFDKPDVKGCEVIISTKRSTKIEKK